MTELLALTDNTLISSVFYVLYLLITGCLNQLTEHLCGAACKQAARCFREFPVMSHLNCFRVWNGKHETEVNWKMKNTTSWKVKQAGCCYDVTSLWNYYIMMAFCVNKYPPITAVKSTPTYHKSDKRASNNSLSQHGNITIVLIGSQWTEGFLACWS